VSAFSTSVLSTMQEAIVASAKYAPRNCRQDSPTINAAPMATTAPAHMPSQGLMPRFTNSQVEV